MPKKKAATDDPGHVSKVRRLGIELSDGVTAEIAAFTATRPYLRETAVRDAIRDEAREAAESAVSGHVAEIIAEKLK